MMEYSLYEVILLDWMYVWNIGFYLGTEDISWNTMLCMYVDICRSYCNSFSKCLKTANLYKSECFLEGNQMMHCTMKKY